MKKILMVSMVFLALLVGCKDSQMPVPKTQEVIIKIQSEAPTNVEVTENQIRKTMSIPYEEPTFPMGTIVIGDMAYYLLWTHINVTENQNLWKLFQIAKYKNIKKIWIYINSGGGNPFDGLAMADQVMRARTEGFTVTTEASGMVASAAIPIFIVGRPRIASEGTIFMIHPGKTWKFFAEEGKEDLIAQQKMFEIEESRYNELIVKNSKLSIEEVEKKTSKTTWFIAKQAKDWGFVDEIK